MPVLIFLRAALIIRIDFMWDKGVEGLGAGPVERNIVVLILILSQDKNFLQQKIIILLIAVQRKRDLHKKNTVLEVIQGIVKSDGSYQLLLVLEFVDPCSVLDAGSGGYPSCVRMRRNSSSARR